MRKNRGFTLLELSTVITIISLLLAGSMSMLVASTQSAQYNATVNTMNTIDQALVNYAVAFGRLPCPSNLILTASSSYYGMEAANPGTGNCTGGTPATNFTSGSSTYRTVEGGIPAVSLHLPDSYMYDGWGHRIQYAVDTSLTAINTNISTATCGSTGAICIGSGSNIAFPPPLGMNIISGTGISVYDSSASFNTGPPITINTGASTPRTFNAAFVLLSHGSNGHGAYTSTGKTVNSGNLNNAERVDCHCTATGASATYSATYVQETPSYQTGQSNNPLYYYDDIVLYKEPWQLRGSGIGSSAGTAPSSPTPSPGIIYASDITNHNLQQYAGSTASWATPITNATIGVGIAPNPLTVQGALVDPSGNLWVSDTANSSMFKYNVSTAAWIQEVKPGLCLGQCPSLSPYTLSPDNTPYYFWVADYGDKQVMKYSFATNSYITRGSHSGTLGGPKGVAVDTSANVWVADTAHNQIGEWVTTPAGSPSGTGSTWNMFPATTTASAALGSFNAPWGIYVDSSNNIWIADTSNNRIQKCTGGTISAAVCTAYGDACQTSSTPACTAAGTIAGYFSGPTAITGDAVGNIWVTDTGNGRIQVYRNNAWSIYTSYDSNGQFTAGTSPTAIWVGR